MQIKGTVLNINAKDRKVGNKTLLEKTHCHNICEHEWEYYNKRTKNNGQAVSFVGAWHMANMLFIDALAHASRFLESVGWLDVMGSQTEKCLDIADAATDP